GADGAGPGVSGSATIEGMASPFPGMDPWLEHPDFWPDVHNTLIAVLRLRLGPILRPRYFVALEERVYLSEPEELVFIGRPDVAVHGRGRKWHRCPLTAPTEGEHR